MNILLVEHFVFWFHNKIFKKFSFILLLKF